MAYIDRKSEAEVHLCRVPRELVEAKGYAKVLRQSFALNKLQLWAPFSKVARRPPTAGKLHPVSSASQDRKELLSQGIRKTGGLTIPAAEQGMGGTHRESLAPPPCPLLSSGDKEEDVSAFPGCVYSQHALGNTEQR